LLPSSAVEAFAGSQIGLKWPLFVVCYIGDDALSPTRHRARSSNHYCASPPFETHETGQNVRAPQTIMQAEETGRGINATRPSLEKAFFFARFPAQVFHSLFFARIHAPNLSEYTRKDVRPPPTHTGAPLVTRCARTHIGEVAAAMTVSR